MLPRLARCPSACRTVATYRAALDKLVCTDVDVGDDDLIAYSASLYEASMKWPVSWRRVGDWTRVE